MHTECLLNHTCKLQHHNDNILLGKPVSRLGHQGGSLGACQLRREQCEESSAHTCPGKPKVKHLDDPFWILLTQQEHHSVGLTSVWYWVTHTLLQQWYEIRQHPICKQSSLRLAVNKVADLELAMNEVLVGQLCKPSRCS